MSIEVNKTGKFLKSRMNLPNVFGFSAFPSVYLHQSCSKWVDKGFPLFLFSGFSQCLFASYRDWVGFEGNTERIQRAMKRLLQIVWLILELLVTLNC